MELVRSFYDGFIVGGDILGLGWSAVSGDDRPLGYNALVYSLCYSSLDGPSKALKPREISEINLKNNLEKAVKCAGFFVGLGTNLTSVGLLNAMLLGEVYSKEEYRDR